VRSRFYRARLASQACQAPPRLPLFLHATGRWANKIGGKLHSLGPWSDPDAALRKYPEQKNDVHAGRKVRADAGALTVKDMANAFLKHKSERARSGELALRKWQE